MLAAASPGATGGAPSGTAAAPERTTGIVLSIDSPALGRVASFELLDSDGERHVFDTSELEFESGFPASHLSEHQVLAERIEVTFVREGDRLVVTHLGDAE